MILHIIALLLPAFVFAQGAGLVSLDEALIGAVKDISSKVSEKEIVVTSVEAPTANLSEFLTGELVTHLSSKFTILGRGVPDALNEEHNLQMSGLVDDKTIVGVGRATGAKVIIEGKFVRFANFGQLRLQAKNVRTAEIIASYTARIKPDELAGVE
jgi:hypothetical protein